MAIPVPFKYQNKVLTAPAGNTDVVDDLAVWTDGKECVSCWKLSLKERLMALLFGRVWVAVLFGNTQPPIYIEASRDFFEEVVQPAEIVAKEPQAGDTCTVNLENLPEDCRTRTIAAGITTQTIATIDRIVDQEFSDGVRKSAHLTFQEGHSGWFFLEDIKLF